MSVHTIGGRSAATAATANHAAAALWNPHASDRIRIREIHIAITTAGVANIGMLRHTARGTAGSSLTAAIQQSDGRDIAAPSGAILDLGAFTVQPTLDSATAYMWRWNLPASVGAGVIFSPVSEIIVPPGAGVCIVTPTAVIFPASDFTFVFED